MSIYSREEYKLQLRQFIITLENNPTTWTEDILDGEVIIGYFFRNKIIKFGEPVFMLSLYTIKERYLETENSVISLQTLKEVFLQWLESLIENTESIMFKNPPIKEWLDVKEEWCKKLASKLSRQYRKSFDDCLSSVYFIVMKVYRLETIYMGNLTYIEIASHNKIRLSIRDGRNRLTGEHPMAIHLDANTNDFNKDLDDGVQTQHEIYGGKRDDIYEHEDYEALREAVIKDLLKKFSEREIDQILTNPKQLPLSLYRKLKDWQKNHKLEDYK